MPTFIKSNYSNFNCAKDLVFATLNAAIFSKRINSLANGTNAVTENTDTLLNINLAGGSEQELVKALYQVSDEKAADLLKIKSVQETVRRILERIGGTSAQGPI